MTLSITFALMLQAASAPQTASDLAVRLSGMTAITGFEQAMVDSLIRLIPGAKRDRAGSAVVTIGNGTPRRLAVCPLDETGYVVGNVLDDRFLTLRRVGPLPGPLYDQWHQGHRVSVWTRRGMVPGVMAVPSTHLARGRAEVVNVVNADDLIVDVGADSRQQLSAIGIDVLDRVALAKAPQRYGKSFLAAPDAARRSACAALATAVAGGAGTRGPGSVSVVFAVESRMRHSGLFTAATTLGPFDRTLLVQYPMADSLLRVGFGQIERASLSPTYGGTPVETVDLEEVERLAAQIGQWIRGAR